MEIAKDKISISFIDIEVRPDTGKVLDFGGVRLDDSPGHDHSPRLKHAEFHSSHLPDFVDFIRHSGFICGHNIFNHDLKYLQGIVPPELFERAGFIDTLLLSPLLFPAKPYHRLVKDDKLNTDDLNNPLNDSMAAMDLLFDEIQAFEGLDAALRLIYFELLGKLDQWKGFFRYLDYRRSDDVAVVDIEHY